MMLMHKKTIFINEIEGVKWMAACNCKCRTAHETKNGTDKYRFAAQMQPVYENSKNSHLKVNDLYLFAIKK